MEARVAEFFFSQIDASALKFDGVKAVVMPKSTYVTQGDVYEADVFLAAYYSGNQPEFSEIIPEEIIDGVGKIRVPARGIGSKKLTGSMTLPGDDKVYNYDVVYTVAPPSVVISPSKMNVLYRNVINPLEISVPGVAPTDIIVNGPGVSGRNGNYNADITKIKGKEIKISVSVKEENGKLRRAGSKLFRIKGLPQAVGSVFKKTQGVMSSSLLSKAKVEAEYQDFPFDLPLKVVSFELKMDGQPPMQVKGDKIPSKAKPLIQKLRPGSSVQIRKIIAKTAKGARISRVGIVSIDVQ
jgi:gliding motility-associated protein GldM